MNKSKPERIIGIDYGLARIGIAYSDERKVIAMPLTVFSAEKKVEHTIANLVKELEKHQKEHQYTIKEIIVGLPLMMNGKQGFLADEVQIFVSFLAKATGLLVKTWDERLTSVQAERSLMESALSRKKRSKQIDKISAVLILQSYLDLKVIEFDR